MSRVLTEAVPGHKSRRNAFFPQHPLRPHRHSENGRLGDFGEPQLFLRAFKTELREFVTERAVGFVEGLPGHWIQRRQLFAHADSLRALPGKKKCDFFFHA